MKNTILVFVPTYNEKDNVVPLAERILQLGLPLDLLFLDDNSPDGTGQKLDALAQSHSNLFVLHGTGKGGIGKAHQRGIAWAYEKGYQTLVTMDADFTHTPEDIPRLLAETGTDDVIVGSRYMNEGSLKGWNLFRKCLTHLGHALTKRFLLLPNDASGAFRVYRLDRVNQGAFSVVRSLSYSFFFESLFVLRQNGYRIKEIPIVLTPRTYGSSKMSFHDAWRSFVMLATLWSDNIRRPEQFLLDRPVEGLREELKDPQNWDAYWGQQKSASGVAYEFIAGAYRQGVIRKNLNRALRREFAAGSRLLHTGCGSGQVDVDVQREMELTALDISPNALRLYARNNPLAKELKHGSIFEMPFNEGTYDGIYNLGVVEHFTHEEIDKILREFRRVLKVGGKAVIFWPHRYASSVWVLKIAGVILGGGKKKISFHPPELSLTCGKKEAQTLVEKAGLRFHSYEFGWRDGFVQAVVIAEKI